MFCGFFSSIFYLHLICSLYTYVVELTAITYACIQYCIRSYIAFLAWGICDIVRERLYKCGGILTSRILYSHNI